MAEYYEDLSAVAGIQYASARYAAKVAEAVEQDMVDLCPVDTGELRDSITSEATGDTVYISVTAGHASFVEFGTSKMRAQPFIRPALYKRRNVVYLDDRFE